MKHLLFSIILVLLLSACESTQYSDIQSRVATGYNKKVKRVHVLSHMSEFRDEFVEPFEFSIKDAFISKGYRANITSKTKTWLSEDDDKMVMELNRFQPDAVLIVIPGRSGVDQFGVREFEVRLKLVEFISNAEWKSGRRPDEYWTGVIKRYPKYKYIENNDIAELAVDIVTRMETDGLMDVKVGHQLRGPVQSNSDDNHEYYIYKDNAQHGPYTREVLDNYLKVGSVTSDDLVWTESMSDWMTLHDFLAKESQ